MAADLRELREDYAAGRLTLDEFAERVGGALQTATHPDLFENHLVEGEKLLWVGRPDPSRRFEKSDLFAVPFSIAWAAFAIFWTLTVLVSGGGLFALFGVPFVMVGLYITVGRFVVRARSRARTWYGVTDRRVLKLERRRSGEAFSATTIASLAMVNCVTRRDGSGSVIFGPPASTESLLTAERSAFGFSDIPDAAYVADLVTQLRQKRPER